MHTPLGSHPLRTDERMDIVVVEAPSPDWRDRILPFLGHKPEEYMEPMRLALDGNLPVLKTRFFLGLLGDEVIANVTTVETLDKPVGILQHVFTAPAHRQKGAADGVLKKLMSDFRARGGLSLHLGTGCGSVAYRLYQRHGFVGQANLGIMRYATVHDFEGQFFAPSACEVREVRWEDWPLFFALTHIADGWYLRMAVQALYGPGGFEGRFLGLMADLTAKPGDGRTKQVRSARVLVSATGAIVGFSCLSGQRMWRDDTLLLDIFVHPNFYDWGEALVAAMQLPESVKIQAFADAGARAKGALLQSCGFRREAVLAGQVRGPNPDDGPVDVEVYARPRMRLDWTVTHT